MTNGDCTSWATVVVIEIEGDTTEDDLKNEIESMLGVQVTVIEISKGVFVITIDNATIASEFVSIVNNICRGS
jgi:hypothetical protein